MAETFAKFRVGTPGTGSAHASYITRFSALEPDNERNRGNQLHLSLEETSGAAALEHDLKDDSFGDRRGSSEADPVWTWNAPSGLTGDDCRINELKRSSIRSVGAMHPNSAEGPKSKETGSTERTQRLSERFAAVRAYFGAKERFEKAKGGRTHYRVILSFDVPATNQEIRGLTNRFLEDTFPKAIGFAAIHRDTDHPHVHIYLHARQIDGKKIYLSRDAYRTIDENWAKIYSQFAGDRSIYVQHINKKEETRQWKIAAAEAYRKSEPIPPKPERDNDRRERLAEQRLSAERSEARDNGRQPRNRPVAEPVMRAGSEKETGRLLAKAELAREQLGHLLRTGTSARQIRSVARLAYGLSTTADRTVATRKENGKERLPAVIYTTEECKQLKEYRTSRSLPVREEHAAARIQAARVMAGAELTDAQGKTEAFRTARHFWKFEVEGWDRKLSLKEVEKEIKSKTDEKFKLYNFLRPSRRESIQGQIDCLKDVKSDLQKQLLGRDRAIEKHLGAARLQYDVASKEAERVQQTRSREGKPVPLPVFQKGEIARMTEIATRNKDGSLLAFAYSQVREKVLEKVTPDALGRVKGHAVMSRMEMLKQSERLKAAIEYGEFRQVPLRDAAGRDYTKSLREVEPRNALELLIRHFTDSEAAKEERQNINDVMQEQLRSAEAQSLSARDYCVALDNIASDHYRAAGVQAAQIAPELDERQIAEVREFAEKQPLLSDARKEFTEAARLGEQALRERGAAFAQRDAEDKRTHEQSTRSPERSPSQGSSGTQRTDRDTFSRGR